MDDSGVINGSDVMASSAVLTTTLDDPHNVITTTLDEPHVITTTMDDPHVSLTTTVQEDTNQQFHNIVYIDEKAIGTEEAILLNQAEAQGELLDQTDGETVQLQLDREFNLVAHGDTTLVDDGTILHADGINGHKGQILTEMAYIDTTQDAGTFQTLMMKTANGELVQVIPIQTMGDVGGDMKTMAHCDLGNIQMVPGMFTAPTMLLQAQGEDDQQKDPLESIQITDSITGVKLGGMIHINPMIPSKVLPPGTPLWATRIQECEKIGDSYRGWVESEVELDLLLTYHKQQTNSFWGTRQSPSPAKPSTRLMWKSQYVHFDGIPFVNAGSRAIVYECQFGPRRKGAMAKRQLGDNYKGTFRQTCPARIYVKKVRKFPEFTVDQSVDKKVLKRMMDEAFMALRESGIESGGEERYYVQLPTEDAHEFHGNDGNPESSHRLDPRIIERIRLFVSKGETRLYVIRKNLRSFVEKDLFAGTNQLPEKHDLTLYPTVNDLQNHIHQAVRDVEAGILPITAPSISVEMITGDLANSMYQTGQQSKASLGNTNSAHTESVTVTLTQNPDDDSHHVISKVETYLSDGSTEISTDLTPETANLLSRLHPNLFTEENIHPKGDSSYVISANMLNNGELSTTATITTSRNRQVHVTMPTDDQYITMDTNDDHLQLDTGDVDMMMNGQLVEGLKQEEDELTQSRGSTLEEEAIISHYNSVQILDQPLDPPIDAMSSSHTDMDLHVSDISQVADMSHMHDPVIMEQSHVIMDDPSVAMETMGGTLELGVGAGELEVVGTGLDSSDFEVLTVDHR